MKNLENLKSCAPSGEGTSMVSRHGQNTIPLYICFSNKEKHVFNVQDIVHPSQAVIEEIE